SMKNKKQRYEKLPFLQDKTALCFERFYAINIGFSQTKKEFTEIKKQFSESLFYFSLSLFCKCLIMNGDF
ncbi:MAG: hypothetical protein U0L08_00910, partial [Bacteroidales bacterium]|nr:hypothetical protein [Bacteroidales bacterium]